MQRRRQQRRARAPTRPVAACQSGRTPLLTLLRSLLQNRLMVLAVEEMRNVVQAAKDASGVRRVVVTSSILAMVPSPGWPSGKVLDERCCTDIDYCKKNGLSLVVAKKTTNRRSARCKWMDRRG